MRLLYLQPAEGFGGAERQSVSAIKHLPEKGIDVTAVVGPGTALPRALEGAGVFDYIYSDALPSWMEGPGTFTERMQRSAALAAAWRKTCKRVSKIVEERKIDVVFAARAFGWIVAASLKKSRETKVVWRAGSRATSGFNRAMLRTAGRLRRPDALISNCEAVEASVAPLLGCSSFVVQNGVDTDRFNPVDARPSFRAALGIGDAPVIGVAARPAPEKGFELLLDVIEKVRIRVPNARVLTAGEYPWRRQYEALFAAHGLDKTVTFLGHVHDMADFYRSCDVILLTSKPRSIEGSPNALLEAMAVRRPVVASKVGGIEEAVTHGVEGFLAEPDDADALACYTARLLLNSTQRKKMGAAGRNTIVSRFSQSISTARLADVLRVVAKQENERETVNLRPISKEQCHDGIA